MKTPGLGVALLLAGALALSACATGRKTAEMSVIDLANDVVLRSVPLAGLPVHAALGKPAVADKGSYRTTSQNFCWTTAAGVSQAREQFYELCSVKGGAYEGSFCRRGNDGDEVLFMAALKPTGVGSCFTLRVAEPLRAPDVPDYIAFLASEGYQTAEARRRATELRAADMERRTADARIRMAAKVETDRVRVAMELPRLKKRGTQVCMLDGPQTIVGYVEDFTDEKLKVLVSRGFLTQAPSAGVRVEPGTIRWDDFAAWRLC